MDLFLQKQRCSNVWGEPQSWHLANIGGTWPKCSDVSSIFSCIWWGKRVLGSHGSCASWNPTPFNALEAVGFLFRFVFAFPLWAPCFSIVLPSCFSFNTFPLPLNPALVPLSLFFLFVTQFPNPLANSPATVKPTQLTILSQFSRNPSPLKCV